jgi:hypothetical protein
MLAAAETRLTGGLARLHALALRLEAVRPVALLAPLCVLQIAIGAWFAWKTPHNGWIWYSGGDASEYWTPEWSLAHGFLPRAVVGNVVPVLFAWVPLVAGPSLLTGAKVIVILQLALLVPAALVCFWGVADRLFGRTFAWAAAALWVLAPLLMLLGFHRNYHGPFEQYFLVPHWYGLTNMGDMPSLVAVLAAAWAVLAALERRSLPVAVLAGLLGGLALGVKPANAFFVIAAAVLVVLERRWRVGLAWALGFVLPLVALAVWKERGLGSLPLGSSALGGSATVALGLPGSGGGAPLVGAIHLGVDPGRLHSQFGDLREVFFSVLLLAWFAVAGTVGALRRSPARGVFLALWFAGYAIVKTGASSTAQVPSASFFRIGEPGLPAYLLLALSTVFLLPRAGRAWHNRPKPTADRPISRRDLRWLAPVVAVAGVLPLAVVAIVPTASAMRTVRDETLVQEAPFSTDFHFAAARQPDGSVRLSWRRPPAGGSSPWFVVLRSPTDACWRPPGGSAECVFNLPVPVLTTTQATSLVDRPGTGASWYWVEQVADFRTTTQGGDLMLVSPGVHVPPAG